MAITALSESRPGIPCVVMVVMATTVCLSVTADVISDSVTSDVTLTVTPSSVHQGLTSTLSVNCTFTPESGSDFTEIISLTMSKADHHYGRKADFGSQEYSEIASITYHSNDQVFVKNTSLVSLGASFTGHLPLHSRLLHRGKAYLSLEWNHPGHDATGQYMCKAFGIEQSGHPRVSTANAAVAEREVTARMCMAELHNLSIAHSSVVANLTEISKVLTEENKNLTNEINDISAKLKAFTDEQSRIATQFGVASSSYSGHSYLLTKPVARDITQSDLLCQNYGGYLVEINDKPEYDFVYDFAITRNNVAELAIGTTDEGHEGTWTFVHSGLPAFVVDKTDGNAGPSDNCIEIWKDRKGMVDEPCTGISNSNNYQTSILCEVPNLNTDL